MGVLTLCNPYFDRLENVPVKHIDSSGCYILLPEKVDVSLQPFRHSDGYALTREMAVSFRTTTLRALAGKVYMYISVDGVLGIVSGRYYCINQLFIPAFSNFKGIFRDARLHCSFHCFATLPILEVLYFMSLLVGAPSLLGLLLAVVILLLYFQIKHCGMNYHCSTTMQKLF